MGWVCYLIAHGPSEDARKESMKAIAITERVSFVGAVDWDRRLFDAIVPLPDGTSYNAYLVRGTEKVALLDTVDPTMADTLFARLAGLERLDYIVSHHAEQDHSGLIPEVLRRFPAAKVIASGAGRNLLQDLLHVPPEAIQVVKDGEVLDLGGLTLRFVMTPWVHWPETMCSWCEEEGILFSCDFFASHLATSSLYASGDTRVMEAAKRYYAEIMMPYATLVRKNIEKVSGLNPRIIAPSHGPLHDQPAAIFEAWRGWTDPAPGKEVAIAFVSMHGSTRVMVDRLCSALSDRGVAHRRFDLVTADLGQLAMSLLDAATLVLATPLVLNGAHPTVLHAAALVNALKPKLKHVAVMGSFGWNGKPLEQAASWLPELKVEWLPLVSCKGLPRAADLEAVESLAQTIADRHAAG